MEKYKEQKERAREKAIEWQQEAAQKNLYISELAEAGARFEKLGKRYGLIKEFKENGII